MNICIMFESYLFYIINAENLFEHLINFIFTLKYINIIHRLFFQYEYTQIWRPFKKSIIQNVKSIVMWDCHINDSYLVYQSAHSYHSFKKGKHVYKNFRRIYEWCEFVSSLYFDIMSCEKIKHVGLKKFTSYTNDYFCFHMHNCPHQHI